MERKPSLSETHPKYAERWDYEQNDVTPDQVTRGSNKVYWWRCPTTGHTWEQAVKSRVRSQHLCVCCHGGYVVTRDHNLEAAFPDVAKDWDSKRNKNILPSDVTPKSNLKFWWKCKNGHRLHSTVKNRVRSSCKYCHGDPGPDNNLAKLYPEAASEWDAEQNPKSVKPRNVSPTFSDERFWWRCADGHTYRETVVMRVRGSGCPKCEERSFDEVASKLVEDYRSSGKLSIFGDVKYSVLAEAIHAVKAHHLLKFLAGEKLRMLSLPYLGVELLMYEEAIGVQCQGSQAAEKDAGKYDGVQSILDAFFPGMPLHRGDVDRWVVNNDGYDFDVVHLDYNGPLTFSHIEAATKLLMECSNPLVFITVRRGSRGKQCIFYKPEEGLPVLEHIGVRVFHREYGGRGKGNLMDIFGYVRRRIE